MKKSAAKRPSPETQTVRKGMVLFNARRYNEACALFEAALALNPKSTLAAVSLAHSLNFSTDEGRALAIVADLVRKFPKDTAVLMSLSRLYLSRREPEKAEVLLRRAVALKADPQASLLLGEILKDRGQAVEASAHLKRAATDKPRSADAQIQLASSLTRFRANVKLGAFAEAFREAERLLEAQGTQDCLDSFIVSPEPRDLMPTLEALKAFSAANPNNPWPRYFRATLLSNQGRGEEALDEAERLSKVERRYHWMRHKYGEILLTNRRDYPAAEKEYAAALKCVPGFWKARAALAEIALCRGEEERAARLSAELIAKLPERSKPWGQVCHGKILLWSGQYEQACEHLDIGVSAAVPYALRHRAGARLLLGRLDEAGTDLEDALRLGADAEGLTWRGELRRLRGDHAGAVEDLTAAIRMDGSNSFWALANRALAKSACGDAAGQWSDFSTIRRDVLDSFETAAGIKAAGPGETAAVQTILVAGLRLARGVRVANEYLFPVWMGHGR